MDYEPVIGLEVHAELLTASKMFCGCAVVDSAAAEPNRFVCPVCAGFPGTLPVINAKAVEYALKVALALDCEPQEVNVFARKNYFYPDLPKGYQISQYELPLARNGRLTIGTESGERVVRIGRVHLEEDTGKLSHVKEESGEYSLVDLNRAGVPLLEIVTEPDLRSVEEMKAYATALRSILRYLGVNSGDMEKGVLRLEANVSVRPVGATELGTRTEVKNINSFRAIVRATEHEIERQTEILRSGGKVIQETVGWDETTGTTFTQRRKEDEDDYRYFPEPDLPPLIIESEWVERVRSELPELPEAKRARFEVEHGLSRYDAGVLVAERAVGEYFEEAAKAGVRAESRPDAGVTVTGRPENIPPRQIAIWLTGSLFGLMKVAGKEIGEIPVTPSGLAELVGRVTGGEVNVNTGKAVLAEMFATGKGAGEIIAARGLAQVNDKEEIARQVEAVFASHPDEVMSYLGGKSTLDRWFVGQVMRAMHGMADPQIVTRLVAERLMRLTEK